MRKFELELHPDKNRLDPLWPHAGICTGAAGNGRPYRDPGTQFAY
jgi:hypothetical protein